jgi:ribose-phosphate pyrophosphokinase
VENAGLRLFALTSSRYLGQPVADRLGVALSRHEEREFEDGEHKGRSLVNVRAADVFVLHSLHDDDAESVNDKLCRLLFFIGALKDAAAASVTAIVPYLGYARKDRRTKPRDPVTTRYVAALFESVRTDRVVTVDVHNPAAFENAFRCPTEHLEARTLLLDHLLPRLQGTPSVIVSPDIGGVKRVEAFRESLGRRGIESVGSAFMEKQRSAGVVSGERIAGDLADRTAVILDDLIGTGTTICRAAAACRKAGARRVLAVATHGLFLGNAGAALSAAGIDELVVTNTVPPFRLANSPLRERLTVLDTAPLLAEAIRRMHTGGSIVELLGG